MEPSDGPDPCDFVQLLMASQRKLYAFIRAQVHNRDDADDVLQQTSTVLWEKFSSFRPDGDFTRWACGVARLEVLSHLRNQQRLRVVLRPDVAEAIGRRLAKAAANLDARLDKLIECMKELARRDRNLIERHYYREETVKEIAAALGISESAVYKSLNRNRDKLYECIQRRLEESEEPEGPDEK
jgi:RNA polymerase sigma-70 factor (ECF subfamily)